MESEFAFAPELDDSEQKTTVLRRYLRDLFNQYVDRNPIQEQTVQTSEPESLKQILAKRAALPEVIKNLPVEARLERRHEIKDTTKPKSKPKAGSSNAAQKRRAQLAAQKFVEPVTTLPMVPVGNSLHKTVAPAPQDFRRAMLWSVVAAVAVALAGAIFWVKFHVQ